MLDVLHVDWSNILRWKPTSTGEEPNHSGIPCTSVQLGNGGSLAFAQGLAHILGIFRF